VGRRHGAGPVLAQQWLDALPQRIGQESVHQGAHSEEHPKTSLNSSSTDRSFRNVHLLSFTNEGDGRRGRYLQLCVPRASLQL
jgi:hypothetical protein